MGRPGPVLPLPTYLLIEMCNDLALSSLSLSLSLSLPNLYISQRQVAMEPDL
jgi:hypothetical protein